MKTPLRNRRLPFLAALIIILTFAARVYARKEAPEPRVFSQIEEISRGLESITGLHFHRRVPAAVIGRQELRKFLSNRVDQVMTPSELRAQEITLKMLGLVPRDYDLKQQTIDLLTEQAAAFYDYQKKKLFVTEGEQGDEAVVTLAHELAHALADQNFNLEKYIGNGESTDSDDAATARMAVMEGQATWLMAAYLQLRQGGEPAVSEQVLNLLSSEAEESASKYPVFTQEPLYIQESLTFPYKAGVLFQDAVFRNLGKDAFAAVFVHAPLSTHQILHPEAYLASEKPKFPDAPEISQVKSYRKLTDGTLGEFDLHVLIQLCGGKEAADALAPHLEGGRFTVFESKRDRKPVLAFNLAWDAPDQALRFFELYGKALRDQARDKSKVSQRPESGHVFEGTGDYGPFTLQATGNTVRFIQGLRSAAGAAEALSYSEQHTPAASLPLLVIVR